MHDSSRSFNSGLINTRQKSAECRPDCRARSRRQSTDRSSDGLSLGVSPGETGGRTGHDGTAALLMASHHRYSVIRARSVPVDTHTEEIRGNVDDNW